jgi:hypothetical protein
MSLSVRERLLAAIGDAVSGDWWLPTPESELDLPFCLYQDGEETATSQYGLNIIELPVSVAKAEAATSTDRAVLRAQCNELLAGIIRDMLADSGFGGLAQGADYVGGTIQTEVGRFCFAEAQFVVRYQTVKNEPDDIGDT